MADRIEVGDADVVEGDAVGGAAAQDRAVRRPPVAGGEAAVGPVADLLDDQEIRRVAELLDRLQLHALDAAGLVTGAEAGVVALEPRPGQPRQLAGRGLARGHVDARQDPLAQGQLDGAALLGEALGVGQGPAVRRKGRRHLAGAAQAGLGRGALPGPQARQRRVEADGGEQLVRGPLPRVEEVAVVLGDQGQVQGPGDGLELAAAAAGGGRVGDQLAVQPAPVGGAGQEAEEPGRGGEEREVGPLAGEDLVETEAVGLEVAAGDHLAQVSVAPGVAGQHDEALAPVGAGAVGPRRHLGGAGAEILVRRQAPPGAGGQDLSAARLGELDPEDGPQALAAALLVVEDEPRHAVGVGKSHGRHPQLPRSPHDFGNTGDTGVERKRRVAVQVDEAQPHLPDSCTYV